MNIIDIFLAVSRHEGIQINACTGYNTCYLAEKHDIIDPEDTSSDGISLRRDIPKDVMDDPKLLEDFLNRMDSDFEKMRNSVANGKAYDDAREDPEEIIGIGNASKMGGLIEKLTEELGG